MPHLIAQGDAPQHRWRRRLTPGSEVIVGRTAAGWATPWDDRISRQHASLEVRDRHLHIRKLAEARNPVFHQGAEKDAFALSTGDHFVIGSTSFSFVDEELGVTQDAPIPLTEQAFPERMLRSVPFRNAARQVEAVSRLPDIIASAGTDDELFVQLVGVLLGAIESASFVAILAGPSDSESRPTEILHWDRRPGTSLHAAPSERLIRRALLGQESVVHLWRGGGSSGGQMFTEVAETDWAFCTPVRGESSSGWALYVAGATQAEATPTPIIDPGDLQDSVKFTELVALTLAQLRDLRQLERHKSTLGQFISPVVLDAVSRHDPEEVLAPREADVSVLFCDLRGFSLKSERSSDDLAGLLTRVSTALGVMTRQILAFDGVIGDFHGDAAMGFWGWPLQQENVVQLACQSALEILAEFQAAQHRGDALADFRVGIGIATGRAVAGKIGTSDQVKVTVFGPVVNLSSRLEDMTKLLRAPILVDEATAQAVRETISPQVARVRRVARIRPYGMEGAVEVSQLLPPEARYPQLTDQDIVAYEAALDALLNREWERAFELLHHVPAEDRVKDFLTVFIAQNNRTPPENWDGVIPLLSKS